MNDHRQVSFHDEPLILVDEQDNIRGHLDKAACHEGEGILHRAFSIFLFDENGRLLLQQRSADKPLWGGYWSNTVCSHPRKGESYETATKRRLADELGIQADLVYLFRFQYQATFRDVGSENEVCSVFIGRFNGPLNANETEVSAVRWMDPDELDEWIRMEPDELTPWFRMEWERIRSEHWETVRRVMENGVAGRLQG